MVDCSISEEKASECDCQHVAESRGRAVAEVRTRRDVLRQEKTGQGGSEEGREGDTSKVNLETPKEKNLKIEKRKNPEIETAVTPTEGYKRQQSRGILRRDRDDTKEDPVLDFF